MEEQLNLLLFKPWLLEARMASLFYRQLVEGKLNLQQLKQKSNEKVAGLYKGMVSQQIGNYVSVRQMKAKSGSNVAVMPVYGTLTKRGDLCSYGMRDYINELSILAQNEDISSIVLDMEGPGGTVDGTNEFGMAVKGSKKPVIVFGDNMVASADYWVASQAKYIVGNKNNPTEFGSIGVLCVHEYWGKFIEENIGSVKIIRAPQSVDKARVNPIEELTPELEKEIQADLKDLAQSFISTVKKGRGAALKASEGDWGTGKMFNVDEAIEMGLIDAKGTLMDAINKAAELASGGSAQGKGAKNKGTNNANNTMTKQKVAEKTASIIMGRQVKIVSAAAQPAAADGGTPPEWTADLIFNTDGSGDGAECLHPDTDGNERQFITKVDNNQGNEPPTDPAINEDDNWLLDEDAGEGDGAAPGAVTTVGKLSAQLKTERAAKKKLATEKAALQTIADAHAAENTTLKAKFAANEKKKAGPITTVIGKGAEGGKGKKLSSWEKEACLKMGIKIEE